MAAASRSQGESTSPSIPSITSAMVTANPNTNPNLNPDPNHNPDHPSVEDQGASQSCHSGGKRKKPGKSKVWDSFTRPLLADGSKDMVLAICNFCNAIVPANSKTNGTSSMWAHGRKCQPCPLYEKPEDKGQTTLNRDNVSGGVGFHAFNQNRCDEKCVKMIIRDELPFRHVEGVGFKEFIEELQPRYKQPSRKVIARGVWEMYQTEKFSLLSHFTTHNTRVGITTDTWTSIQNINYMVVTAHFLDSDWKLHKRIINFCSITSHKGDDIGRVLEQCLLQWGLNRIFTITVDNASSNDVAINYMKRRLKQMSFRGNFLHLRCACHIINLIVKDGIEELQDGIEAIWNCVKFVRSSSSRLDKFREFSVLEQLNKNANIPLDVITRWNVHILNVGCNIKV